MPYEVSIDKLRASNFSDFTLPHIARCPKSFSYPEGLG